MRRNLLKLSNFLLKTVCSKIRHFKSGGFFKFKSSPCVLMFFPRKLRVGGIQTKIVDAPASGTDPSDLILYDKLENPKRKGDPHWLFTRV